MSHRVEHSVTCVVCQQPGGIMVILPNTTTVLGHVGPCEDYGIMMLGHEDVLSINVGGIDGMRRCALVVHVHWTGVDDIDAILEAIVTMLMNQKQKP